MKLKMAIMDSDFILQNGLNSIKTSMQQKIYIFTVCATLQIHRQNVVGYNKINRTNLFS